MPGPYPGGFWKSPRRLHSLSGKPVQCSIISNIEMLPGVQGRPPACQHMSTASCPLHGLSTSQYVSSHFVFLIFIFVLFCGEEIMGLSIHISAEGYYLSLRLEVGHRLFSFLRAVW